MTKYTSMTKYNKFLQPNKMLLIIQLLIILQFIILIAYWNYDQYSDIRKRFDGYKNIDLMDIDFARTI